MFFIFCKHVMFFLSILLTFAGHPVRYFLTFQGALGGHFGTLLAPEVALGLLEGIFGQFRLSIVTFGVAFWRLWGPLWPTLAAFGLRLGALWETFGSFEAHFGHFVEAFWRLLATFHAVLGELLEKS